MSEGAWSADELVALCRLWAEGVPTAEIARRLGRTKNMVVGKAHRLGLPARPSPIRRDGAARPAPAGLRRPTEGLATAMGGGLVGNTLMALGIGPPPAPEARPAAAVVAFAAVGSRPCLWPMWGDRERPTQRFCGAAGVPGRSYCAAHHAVAFTRAPAVAPGPRERTDAQRAWDAKWGAMMRARQQRGS